MSDSLPDPTILPIFRASKRRKIVKRTAEHSEDDNATTQDDVHDEREGDQGQLTTNVRKPGPRRQALKFSSQAHNRTGSQETAADNDVRDLALVPAPEGQEITQANRFVKPMGKIVVEDKHLMAYVDSKLAELQASQPHIEPSASIESSYTPGQSDEHSLLGDRRPAQSKDTATTSSAAHGIVPIPRANPCTKRQPRRRSPGRDATDDARDAMVDALMRESGGAVMYSEALAATSLPSCHQIDTPRGYGGVDEAEVDNDTAAAEAFKANFLADLANRAVRRKPAAIPGGAGAGPNTAGSGPKLGGSRAQREKMKALEEAAAAAAATAASASKKPK